VVTSENGRPGLPSAGWLGFCLRPQPSQATVRRAQEATGAHGGLAGVGLDVPASPVDLGKEPAAMYLAHSGDGERAHAVSQVRCVANAVGAAGDLVIPGLVRVWRRHFTS